MIWSARCSAGRRLGAEGLALAHRLFQAERLAGIGLASEFPVGNRRGAWLVSVRRELAGRAKDMGSAAVLLALLLAGLVWGAVAWERFIG